jgi:F-type H+-transporting ATPase subunit gamma
MVAGADRNLHPLMQAGKGDKVCIIVVTSDRGLCGSFNGQVVNETMRLVRGRFADKNVEVVVVGRKGVESLHRRPVKIRSTHVGAFDKASVASSERIVEEVTREFVHGDTGAVYCLYNEFKSAISQHLTLEQLLPYAPSDEATPGMSANFIYEPSAEEILSALLLRDLQVQMNRILHESSASEHGARMTAMESATKNAGEVIDRLTLRYNRVRQDAITREVVEVVSGAEAL